MAKSRRPRPSSGKPAAIVAPVAPPKTTRLREVDLLAVAALALCLVAAWLSRHMLNPDGVSYFDLAAALRRGDGVHFIQAYWSPLYPALIAAGSALAGASGAGMMTVAHAINALAALLAAGILWRWSRAQATPFFGRAAFAALLICGAGLPHVETVTPDVLLLAITAWLSYELIAHGGRRWWLCGLLFGVAYLTKTSAWPWIIVAVPLRLWAGRDLPGRRRVWQSTLITAVMMLWWIIPISVKTHHPTLGSTGALNYGWYLRGHSTERSPDTDPGQHASYYTVSVDNEVLTLARFQDAAIWTYQPWSDPTAWHAGIQHPPADIGSVGDVITYWVKSAAQAFWFWLLPLIAAVMLPMLLAGQRRGMWHALAHDQRDIAVVMLLGAIGFGQFVAVHAEPRLLAPFALMLALGAIAWSCEALTAGAATASRQPAWVWPLASSIGLVVVLFIGWSGVQQSITDDSRTVDMMTAFNGGNAKLGHPGTDHPRIVILGEAIPVEAAAYLTGGQIVGQLLPRSMPDFLKLPSQRRITLIDDIFAGKADVAWLVNRDAGMQLIKIPPLPDSLAHH